MVSKQKDRDISARNAEKTHSRVARGVLRAAKVTPLAANSALRALLEINAIRPPYAGATSVDWAHKEVECAREFNFQLPEDIRGAVELMEQALQSITGTQKSIILVFDENSGVYTCLNDEKRIGIKPRELTRISDGFLQEFIGCTEVIHSYMLLNGNLTGIVAVADKQNGAAFNAYDQILLDLIAPYLATKVLGFRNLKQSLSIPYIQSVVLDMAGHLVSAVDQDSILTGMLEAFVRRLGFDACQYVGLNTDTGCGEVLYEIKGVSNQVASYSHAGLESKRKVISDFSSLVGLLSSMARNKFYLYLKGEKLGDHSLSDIFGIKKTESTLILPVVDTTSGEIRGTFNLFHTTPALISDESIEIAREAAILASKALSRSLVLEKALAMASSDELTGLLNRRAFYQRFEAEIERARRQQTSLCVALIDVDHFKKLNDRHGHLSGDKVLKTLSDLFVQNVRKSDVVCRFGGEEFAVLLPDTSMKAARDLMERIRKNVEKLKINDIYGAPLKITISSGVTLVSTMQKMHDTHQTLISDSLAVADELLYAAKNLGRNQVCTSAAKA